MFGTMMKRFDFILLWYVLLLAATSEVRSTTDRRRSVFKIEGDEFHSVLVTQSDDVIVHLQETLLQFRYGNITENGIIHRANISTNQTWDQSKQTYHFKPTIFQSFDASQTEYLFLCHFIGCSVYDAGNISINNAVRPDNKDSKDALLKEKTTAQIVIYKSFLYSAVTDSFGISTLSYSYFYGLMPDSATTHVSLDKSFKSKEYQHFDFVFSFKAGKYIYFLRNVEEDFSGKVMISQLCADDNFFRSYIESTLRCRNFSKVLSATIINDTFLALAMGTNDNNALCVFEIKRIKHHFKQALERCFKNREGTWPQWINETGKSCSKISENSQFTCGHTNSNTRILSSQSLNTSYITKLDSHVADQSMVFKDYNGTVYGYIGFRTGNIWKVIFDEPSRRILNLSSMEVSNTPIRQLVLSNNGSSLLYISAKTLGTIEVEPTCPPTINMVKPLNGDLNGGTTLTFNISTVYGANNARPSVNITIGNDPCRNITVEPSNSRMTCVTPEQQSVGNVTIKVEIQMSSPIRCSGSTEYDYMFAYMVPLLDNSTTTETQRIKLSGCVPISVHGNNLNIGAARQMLVGDRSCNIISFNSTMVTCIAPEQHSRDTYPVTLRLDDTKLIGPLVTYIPEPNVTSIEPQYTNISGGIVLTITGENLEGLGTDLRLHIQGFSSSICKTYGRLTTFTIECVTPAIRPMYTEQSFLRGENSLCAEVEIPLLIVPDSITEENHPVINETEQTHVSLFFKGYYLTYIRKSDVTISVGNATCLEVKVQAGGISCKITRDSNPEFKYRIQVKMGLRTYNLGTVALGNRPESSSHNQPNDGNNYVVAIIGTIFAAICIACVTVYICWRIRRRRHNNSVRFESRRGVLSVDGLPGSRTSGTLQGRPNDYMSSRFLCTDNTTVKEPMSWTPLITQDVGNMLDDKQLLIAKECLMLGDIIGQGNFGCVYKGFLQLSTEKSERIVACKTLLRTHPEELDVNAFLKEAIVMKDFHHKNVMDLLGICLGIKALPMVVLPFMSRGDALSYIRDVSNIPTVKQLVEFGVDVANGMDYLSQLKFVHRDLAARNCMIADDMTVKVADFGLSRDVYEKEYYTCCDKKAKLPVKWMSPESLEFGIYTTQSDVWSFGVLMWELLTRGVNPYPTVDGWDILRYLKTGRRLNRPDFCPHEMHPILQSCWEWDPDKRPTFKDLTTSIPALLRRFDRASDRRKQISSRPEDKNGTKPIGVFEDESSNQDYHNVENISGTEERVEREETKTCEGDVMTEEIKCHEDGMKRISLK